MTSEVVMANLYATLQNALDSILHAMIVWHYKSRGIHTLEIPNGYLFAEDPISIMTPQHERFSMKHMKNLLGHYGTFANYTFLTSQKTLTLLPPLMQILYSNLCQLEGEWEKLRDTPMIPDDQNADAPWKSLQEILGEPLDQNIREYCSQHFPMHGFSSALPMLPHLDQL